MTNSTPEKCRGLVDAAVAVLGDIDQKMNPDGVEYRPARDGLPGYYRPSGVMIDGEHLFKLAAELAKLKEAK